MSLGSVTKEFACEGHRCRLRLIGERQGEDGTWHQIANEESKALGEAVSAIAGQSLPDLYSDFRRKRGKKRKRTRKATKKWVPAHTADSCGMHGEGPALVLGMFYATPEYLEYQRQHQGSTLAAPIRDVRRVHALEKALDRPVFTMNDDNPETPGEATKFHIQLTWGTDRSMRMRKEELRKRLGPHGASIIFLDYFRFPSAYMVKAYTDGFFNKFLPALVREGLLISGGKIVAPNLPRIIEKVDRRLWKLAYMRDPTANLLYRATDTLTSQELGGYSNAREIEQLDREYPFICMSLK